MSAQKPDCMLYLITPDQIEDLDIFAKTLSDILKATEVACVQLRLKGVDDATIVQTGLKLVEVCHEHDVPLILNDRADLVPKIDADGVHLGQGDGAVADAREIIGHMRDIGVTCHDSMDLAFAAGEAGANYVAFGAFFPTDTKETVYKPEPSLLTVWDEIAEIPSVAIGGITVDNCAEIISAGADLIAVSGAVWNYPDGPVAGASAIISAMKAAGK